MFESSSTNTTASKGNHNNHYFDIIQTVTLCQNKVQ